MHLTHIRFLDVTEPLASGHAHLSAASGLASIGDTLFVIGDDEQHLALFNQKNGAPGSLLRLLPGDLPRKKKKRKAVKPDFEILFALPSADNDLLCAIGSGSTDQRMRAAIIYPESETVIVHDLTPLFGALAPLTAEINLEGAVVRGDRLLLFNRGNMAHPETCIFETALAAITGGELAAVTLLKTLTLPLIADVPLTVTDACALGDDRILLSAVAEVTDDSYADGDILGAAIVVLGADLDILAIEPLVPVVKIEGISARHTATAIELLCVSDADDPDSPSSLYSAILKI